MVAIFRAGMERSRALGKTARDHEIGCHIRRIGLMVMRSVARAAMVPARVVTRRTTT